MRISSTTTSAARSRSFAEIGTWSSTSSVLPELVTEQARQAPPISSGPRSKLGTLENQLASLEDRSGPFLARLNASLNRSQSTPIPFPTEVQVVPLGAKDEEVFSWIAAGNPELRALQHEMESARAAAERAEKDFYPDLTLGV